MALSIRVGTVATGGAFITHIFAKYRYIVIVTSHTIFFKKRSRIIYILHVLLISFPIKKKFLR